MRRGRIHQHHGVATLVVAEVVVNALLLHEAAHEVEVGLAVLHAVVPLSIARRHLELEVRRRVVREHLLDDVGYRHLLEDPAVGSAAQEPQPWARGGGVPVASADHAALRKAADIATEVAELALRYSELH